ESGRAFLADFGLARFEHGDAVLTSEGAVVGTPAYMSPEQASPKFGPVTAQSDLYSLGVVLFHMFTGRQPFEGNQWEVLYKLMNRTPPPPSQFRPDLDPVLAAVVERAKARLPQDRFADVGQFAAALTGWLEQGAAALAPSPDAQPPAGETTSARPAEPITP